MAVSVLCHTMFGHKTLTHTPVGGRLLCPFPPSQRPHTYRITHAEYLIPSKLLTSALCIVYLPLNAQLLERLLCVL